MQIVLAGKAHPRDEEGKRVVRALRIQARHGGGRPGRVPRQLQPGDRAALVAGCDVWINVPRPPLEASGTSGMKAALNGGLNLTVLDGWWAEAYDGTNGWAISGEVDEDHTAQDERDAASLHSLLTDEVVPAFYDRDAAGLPIRWLELMRSSLRTLPAQFSATRMVRDYVRGPYAGDSHRP